MWPQKSKIGQKWNSRVPRPQKTVTFNFGSKHHNLVVGLIEFSEPVALNELCPDGAAYAEHALSFIDLVIASALQSFYTPLTVTVYCDSGSSAEVLLNDEGDAVAYLPLEQPEN